MRRFFVAGTLVALLCLGVVGTASAAPIHQQLHQHAAPAVAPGPKVGATVTARNCQQPPKVSLATLASWSDQQLEFYGLPAHAAVPNEAQWAYLVAHDHHRACTGGVTPYTFGFSTTNTTAATNHADSATSAIRAINEHGPITTTPWSGYSSDSAEGWRYTETYWTVPSITNCTYNASVGDWVGEGGTGGSNRLIQTGSADQTDICIGTVVWGWVENLGNQVGTPGYDPNYPYTAIHIYNFPVGGGDQMFAYTYQIPGDVEMYIQNISRGISSDWVFGPTPQTSNYECIHELVTGFDLLPTTNVPFSGCEAQDVNSNWSLINNNNHGWYDLWIEHIDVCAEPTTPDGSGNFTVDWLNFN